MATEQELQSLFNTLDRDQDGKVSINGSIGFVMLM
jgi:serine/threonine-protein phosphatase 2B regulatory subunit